MNDYQCEVSSSDLSDVRRAVDDERYERERSIEDLRREIQDLRNELRSAWSEISDLYSDIRSRCR